MMYNGMMGEFGTFFIGIYVVGIVYFLYTLSSIAKSLAQIANKMDKDA
jgi:hypothetical protein